jgi:hypothetical protein
VAYEDVDLHMKFVCALLKNENISPIYEELAALVFSVSFSPVVDSMKNNVPG